MIGFHLPLGFIALGTLLLLFFVSFLKRRPVEVVVGSVRLWKNIPDRVASLEAAKRPRYSLSLLLQAASIILLAVALAAPHVVSSVPPLAMYLFL